MNNRLRPEKVADERQQSERRADMHRLVDELCDMLPQVQHQAREMGRGFPSSSIAGFSGGGGGSVVENSFDDNGNLKWDPAEAARDALTDSDAAFYSLKSVVKRFERLTHGAEKFTAPGVRAPVEVVPPSPDDCHRCRRVISGTASTDQNKSGFCSECFSVWVEMGRPDRGDFLRMPDCPECHKPVLKGEGRSFADMPTATFHGNTCYFRVYRQRQKGA